MDNLSFTAYIEALDKNIETVVAITDRTHYIFTNNDTIEIGWTDLFVVKEIISINHNSVIVRLEYIDEE